MYVGKTRLAGGPRPLAPGDRDARDLVLVQLRERADVPRGRDDDLVMLEDRVEVRDDANCPARCVGLAAARTDREGLRWGSVLPALAERAGVELFLGRQIEVSPRACSRPLRPGWCDDDPLSGDRVLAKLPRRRLRCRPRGRGGFAAAAV
jgi:hypothetical protein